MKQLKKHDWLVVVLILVWLFLSGFIILAIYQSAHATDFPLEVVAPVTNQNETCLDSIPGTTLKDLRGIRFYGQRILDSSPTPFGEIPAYPGDTLRLDLDLDDTSAGLIWATATDSSNNESCIGAQMVFAIPFDTTGTPGLKGEYYRGVNFNQLVATRVDSVIDFDWGLGAPPGCPVDSFSVRWTGRILLVQRGNWTKFASTEDGVRAWIDGVLRIDRWIIQNETEVSWVGELSPGAHDIRIDFFHNRGHAAAHLRWDGPIGGKETVPTWALRH